MSTVAQLFTFGLACLLTVTTAAAEPAPRPNIVVILADDLGFSDIGCYGSEIPTPNLDALAANGLRFTQFYNNARCCPSRAALLTGLHPHQAGVGHMTENQGAPGYLGRLNATCVTIPEVLSQAGYFTAQAGKWHVGWEGGASPTERGFARSLCAKIGGFYFPDSARTNGQLFLDGNPLTPHDPRLPPAWYSTDLWTDFSLRFIAEARQVGKPFFLYLAANAPHFPLQAPAAEIDAFRGKFRQGWDRLREERLARQIRLGLMPPESVLTPRPASVKPWAALDPAAQDRFDHLMAIYAATVAHLDTAIGRLVADLRANGQLDNTMILFMSDNGGNAESGPQGESSGGPLGSATSLVKTGESWAVLQNTPLRRFKHFAHEGGIATPLIVHWPAGIPDRGALRTQPGHLIDVMATCVAVAGATYPATRQGLAVPPMEGLNLVPAFAGAPLPRTALYWEHEGNAAIRVGDRKLVRQGRSGPWELYDLATDRLEVHDLAAAHPETASELAAQWKAWAERTHVLPWPTRKKGPAAK
jgi:arylsulfatase